MDLPIIGGVYVLGPNVCDLIGHGHWMRGRRAIVQRVFTHRELVHEVEHVHIPDSDVALAGGKPLPNLELRKIEDARPQYVDVKVLVRGHQVREETLLLSSWEGSTLVGAAR